MALTYSYNTANPYLSKVDFLRKLANHYRPTLSMFIANPAGTPSDPSVKDVTHKWVDKTLKGRRGKLHADITNSGTSITVEGASLGLITTATSDYYSMLVIGDEYIKVASATLSGDIWTCTCTAGRGLLSTTAAAHAAGTPVHLVNRFKEGADAGAYDQSFGTEVYNYTQIIRAEYALTGTAQAVQTYGNELDLNTIRAEVMPALFQEMENALFSPIRANDGAGFRTMGGFPYFVTSDMTKDSAGNRFALKTVAEDIDLLVEKGVDTNNLIMIAGSSVLTTLADKKAQIVQETMKLRELDYQLFKLTVPGNHSIKVSEWAPVLDPNEYYIFPMDSVKVKFFRPLDKVAIAKTGDSDKEMLVSELTTEFHGFQKGGALRRKNVA